MAWLFDKIFNFLEWIFGRDEESWVPGYRKAVMAPKGKDE